MRIDRHVNYQITCIVVVNDTPLMKPAILFSYLIYVNWKYQFFIDIIGNAYFFSRSLLSGNKFVTFNDVIQ